MKIIHNANLSEYTTIKIGGGCSHLYFPENENELIDLIMRYPIAPIIGGGSNILINDEKQISEAICLKEFNKYIRYEANLVHVGAGVRLQKLILDINEHGLGGIEYLFSVPGLVGGAVYMNAGRGRSYNQSISDYIESVRVLDNGEIKELSKEDCEFSYRNSIFRQNKGILVLAVVFRFKEMEAVETKKLRDERIALVKTNQDNRYPNAGTTFCESNHSIMRLCMLLSGNRNSGCHLSNQKPNWLQNRGAGTFKEALKQIRRVELLHRLFGQKCKLELELIE